jgi:alpha-tubulin suppressor-like RCC1 family protein
VKCWGDNQFGQLGNGTLEDSDVPVEVVGLTDARTILAGRDYTCALTRFSEAKCWGSNMYGQLGDGTNTDRTEPVGVVGLPTRVYQLDLGDYHACALTEVERKIYCWGNNKYGQLGDDTKTDSNLPVKFVTWMWDLISVAAGGGHTCAVGGPYETSDCQGDNRYGQLSGGSHLDAVEATGDETCVTDHSGYRQCWGRDNYGQRGFPFIPYGFGTVALGWNHSCGSSDSEYWAPLYCWGWNYYGQLGDGTRITRGSYKPVKDMTERVQSVAAGWAHTCAAMRSGAVKCWGANDSGQLGDGTRGDRSTPVEVIFP